MLANARVGEAASSYISSAVNNFIYKRYSQVATAMINQGIRPPASTLACRQSFGASSCSQAFADKVMTMGVPRALKSHADECVRGRKSMPFPSEEKLQTHYDNIAAKTPLKYLPAGVTKKVFDHHRDALKRKKARLDNGQKDKDFYAYIVLMTGLSFLPKDFFNKNAKQIWAAVGLLSIFTSLWGYEGYGDPVAYTE